MKGIDMIGNISVQPSRGIYATSLVKSDANPLQERSYTDLHASGVLTTIPYHIPLSFKGAQSNSILSQIQHNDASIDNIDKIRKLPECEKQAFVEKYCALTGFPNLEEVNHKICDQAKNAIQTASKNADIPVLWSGYHKNCSVSKGYPLPGSDLDGWAIIVDGNQDQINNFKGELWQNTNPLFASIKKEFPYIFSIDQLCEWAKFADEIVVENGLDKKAEKYENNLKEMNDYEKALMFNIDIRKAIEGYDLEKFKEKVPSMADDIKARIGANEPTNMIPIWITQSMSTCLEPLRSGVSLIDPKDLKAEQKEKLEQIKNSNLYKYGNMSMQELAPGLKAKLIERKVINKEWFDDMTLDKKIDFISRMIYEPYSSTEKGKIETKYGESFEPLFNNGDGVNEARGRAINQACA